MTTHILVGSLTLAGGYAIGLVTASTALRGQIADLRQELRLARLDVACCRDELTRRVLQQMGRRPVSDQGTRTNVVAPIVAMRSGGLVERPAPVTTAIDARLDRGAR